MPMFHPPGTLRCRSLFNKDLMKQVRMIPCRLITVMSKVPLVSLLFQWLFHDVKTCHRAQLFEEDGKVKVATGYCNELQILYIRERFLKLPETSAGSRRQLDTPTVIPRARGERGGFSWF